MPRDYSKNSHRYLIQDIAPRDDREGARDEEKSKKVFGDDEKDFPDKNTSEEVMTMPENDDGEDA